MSLWKFSTINAQKFTSPQQNIIFFSWLDGIQVFRLLNQVVTVYIIIPVKSLINWLLMALCGFPNSSLLIPAVSCLEMNPVIGLNRLHCVLLLLTQGCSLRQPQIQNGWSCFSTSAEGNVSVDGCKQMPTCHNDCQELSTFSNKLLSLSLSAPLHSGSTGGRCRSECFWPRLHCVSLHLDLLPAQKHQIPKDAPIQVCAHAQRGRHLPGEPEWQEEVCCSCHHNSQWRR